MTSVCRGVVICCVIFLSACGAPSNLLSGTQTAPVRFFTLGDGSPVFIDEYLGKSVVVAFWSTACSASASAISELANYAEKFKNDQRVVFIAASLDAPENTQLLKNRIQKEQTYSLIHMFSGNEEYDEMYNALKGERIPYIVVIDKDGKIVATDTNYGFVRDLIQPGRPMPIAGRKLG